MTVVEVRGRTVKLGFVFPPDASVLRKEIFDNIREQNVAASKADSDIGLNDILGALHSHGKQDKPDGE
jgi:carbon storage regulator